jgi:hypothetical protein
MEAASRLTSSEAPGDVTGTLSVAPNGTNSYTAK